MGCFVPSYVVGSKVVVRGGCCVGRRGGRDARCRKRRSGVVQMTWLGSLGYVPILEPWPLTPHRPRLEETLDEIRDDVENEIGSEDAATSDASEVDIFPELASDWDYKHIIYDDEWATRETDELKYFLRRLGTGGFIALYIVLGQRWSDRISGKVKLPMEYDPDKITAFFQIRPEKVALRTLEISVEALKYGLGAAYDNFSFNLTRDVRAYRYLARKALKRVGLLPKQESPKSLAFAQERKQREKDYWDWRYQRRASNLRESLTKLGPAFVKIGQLLAARPDIVGTQLVRELQRLQDDIPFFANEEAFQFIREELGADPDKIFSNLSKRPVAAASLGQVYKAELDSVPIAVKVQRPGMVEAIALDFFILRRMGRYIGRYLESKSNFTVLIDDYALHLFEELDYVQESQNMARFRSLYGRMEGIYIPQVFTAYSSRHVLVMEWVDGEKLVDDSATVREEDVPLVEVGIRCCLTQLLDVGYLHADPHAGNLIRTRHGRLAYLDFGLISIIPESVRTAILCACLHLINREYQLLAEDFASMSILQAYEVDLEVADFSKALMDEFEPLLSKGIQNFTFIGVAEKLLFLATQFPLIFPAYFLNNMRALATLEGLALTADPNFKIFRIIYPYVVNRVLYDENPVLKRALEELVVDDEGAIRWNRLEAIVSDAEPRNEEYIGQKEPIKKTSQGPSNPKSLVNFVLSPGGSSLRKIFVSQLCDDVFFRFERFMDRLEAFLLPPSLRPPDRCTGVCSDVQYVLRLKENRRRARMLFVKMRGYNFLSLLRLIPLFFMNALYIAVVLTTKIMARVIMDVCYVAIALGKGLNFIERARAQAAAEKGLATEVTYPNQGGAIDVRSIVVGTEAYAVAKEEGGKVRDEKPVETASSRVGGHSASNGTHRSRGGVDSVMSARMTEADLDGVSNNGVIAINGKSVERSNKRSNGVPVAKMNGTVRGQTEEKESLDESEDDKDRRFASTDTGRTNLVSGKSSNPS